jgi:hypothetical protein
MQYRNDDPSSAGCWPPAPVEVQRALRTLDHAVRDYITKARLGLAA